MGTAVGTGPGGRVAGSPVSCLCSRRGWRAGPQRDPSQPRGRPPGRLRARPAVPPCSLLCKGSRRIRGDTGSSREGRARSWGPAPGAAWGARAAQPATHVTVMHLPSLPVPRATVLSASSLQSTTELRPLPEAHGIGWFFFFFLLLSIIRLIDFR